MNPVHWLKRNPARAAVLLFFAAFLALGLSIYRDYGIAWDEYTQLEIGKANYRFITKGNTDLFSLIDAHYGPLYEIFLVRVMDQSSPRAMYLSRHLWVFLTFYAGVAAFYWLARKAARSDWLALLGCGLLAACPRIFADAFYNSKDIPFLVFAIFTASSLAWYLEKPRLLRLTLHALLTGAFIAIRAPGIYMPALTLGMLLIEVLARRIKPAFALRDALTYLLLAVGFTFIFFPYLWRNPLESAREALLFMANFPQYMPVFYQGRFITPTSLPWHYIPVWMAITLPPAYLALGALGLGAALTGALRRPAQVFAESWRIRLLALAWLFGPLLAVILLHSSLYDAWRQMFFIYPALALLALDGAAWLAGLPGRRLRPPLAKALIAVGCLGLFAPVAARMIEMHPYQNVYFNRFAGADMQAVKARFDLDYWGLSYRAGLEYILAHDDAERISVYADTDAGWRSAAILGEEGEKRLNFLFDPAGADYYLGNYRWHPEDYPYPNEVFSVRVGNAKILSVFKLK